MNLVLLDPCDFTDEEHRTVRLTGRRAGHLLSTCRVAVGGRIRAGLINGPLGHGTILRAENDLIEMNVDLSEAAPAPLPLTLVIALPRPKSLNKSLEAASSLGIKRIFIIESWRVEKSYWASPVLEAPSLREHLLLGLEQARDTMLPRIELRRYFKPFVEDELPGIVGESLALVAHPYEAGPCPFNVQKPVVLMIGPEGGFIPYEIETLKQRGFSTVTIGQRILRVETAIAAFAGRLW